MKRVGGRWAPVRSRWLGLTLAVLAAGPLHARALGAQAPAGTAAPHPVSLDEALRMAQDQSEQITIARAGVLRAQGQEMQARSEYFPQISASLAYSRALASQFSNAFSSTDTTAAQPVCPAYTPDPSLPIAQRVALLEAQQNCTHSTGGFGGFNLSNLPFGRVNTYQLGLSVSQNLFAGGRIAAQTRVARAGRETAEVSLRQAEAQLALDVTQAYYDAALSEQLLAIAQATLQQAETTLQQTQVARQVGTQPEFELLRAQVTRDNQRPVVIQRQTDRDLAFLRLKQLLRLPADEPLQLTSAIEDTTLLPAQDFAARLLRESAPAAGDTIQVRAAVLLAEQAVAVQAGQLDVAQSQRLPSLIVSSQYGRVAYPANGVPSWSDSQANWNVGLSLAVPIFSGGRVRGGEKVAQANLLEARARLQQVQELASIDTRSAYDQLSAAQASWQASSGTVEQAQRAYQIAEVRYREGISTQVELSDARILLQQAEANRAQSARNLQLARARIALLPYLPLSTGGSTGTQQGATTQQTQSTQQTQQTTRQTTTTTGTQSAFTGVGGF